MAALLKLRYFVTAAGACITTNVAFSQDDKNIYAQENQKRLHRERKRFSKAIKISKELIERAMIEGGIPGAVVAVSVDGRMVWNEGLGYSDVENFTPCSNQTVMRIASISKAITAVAVAKLWEEGKLDLDTPVQKYVPAMPEKTFEGNPVIITTRQLLSHMGCIRHYGKAATKRHVRDSQEEEFYSLKHYKSVTEALKIFEDDNLICLPGSSFNYTTYGWTLVSAVIEGVSKVTFLEYLSKNVLDQVGTQTIEAEFNGKLTPHRSRYYERTAKHLLQNSPYVDISNKWAGGGLVSNASDLVLLGNTLLQAYQGRDDDATTKFFLKPSTVKVMWTPIKSDYGWGWYVYPDTIRFFRIRHFDSWGLIQRLKKSPRVETLVTGDEEVRRPLTVMHTGGAVGASSVLLIQESQTHSQKESQGGMSPVEARGVVVAILFNLQDVSGIFKLAKNIAKQFNNINAVL